MKLKKKNNILLIQPKTKKKPHPPVNGIISHCKWTEMLVRAKSQEMMKTKTLYMCNGLLARRWTCTPSFNVKNSFINIDIRFADPVGAPKRTITIFICTQWELILPVCTDSVRQRWPMRRSVRCCGSTVNLVSVSLVAAIQMSPLPLPPVRPFDGYCCCCCRSHSAGRQMWSALPIYCLPMRPPIPQRLVPLRSLLMWPIYRPWLI